MKKNQDGRGCVYARYRIHTKDRKEGFIGWWVKFYRNGEQIVRNGHTTDRAEAERQLAQLLGEQAKGVQIARRQFTLEDAVKNVERTAAAWSRSSRPRRSCRRSRRRG